MLLVLIVTSVGPLLGIGGLFLHSPWLFWIGVAICFVTLCLNMASGAMKPPVLPILSMAIATVFSAHWYVGLGIGLVVWMAFESLGEIAMDLALLARRMR